MLNHSAIKSSILYCRIQYSFRTLFASLSAASFCSSLILLRTCYLVQYLVYYCEFLGFRKCMEKAPDDASISDCTSVKLLGNKSLENVAHMSGVAISQLRYCTYQRTRFYTRTVQLTEGGAKSDDERMNE